MLGGGQFYGAVTRRLTTHHVALAEVFHPNGCTNPEHAHLDAQFTLLLKGAYDEAAAGAWTRSMHPLNTAFSPAGFAHRDRVGRGGARFFTVSLRRSLVDEFSMDSDFWQAPHVWESAAVGLPLLRLYAELANTRESLDPLTVEDRLALLIEAADAQHRIREPRRPRWVDAARARICDCPDTPLRVVDLARDAGVHPVHFSRTFRQFVGVRPAEYRARTRVAAGCRLAASTSLPLSQVALAAGFADQSHMTRAFGRILGIAPAAYRALLNGGSERVGKQRLAPKRLSVSGQER